MVLKLQKLAKKEQICINSLKTLEQLVSDYVDERDKLNLKVWLERLETLFGQYEDIRLELELTEGYEKSLEQSFAEANDDEMTIDQFIQNARADVERAYLQIKSFIVSKINEISESNEKKVIPCDKDNRQPESHQSRVKLPEIKLPCFDASIREWPTFRDTFKSLIDSNSQINNVDKFSYLISSLSKEAKRAIDVIEVTSDNYSVAWEILERRYENKYLIVKAYVEALFAIEPMRKECDESLCRLVDEFERNLMMLDKVGENSETWSTLLVFMLSSRLDPVTMRHWEAHRKSTNVPTYRELIEFLRSHCLVLQSVASTKNRSSDSSRTTAVVRNPSSKISSLHSALTKSCAFCKKPSHSPFQCELFKKMTPHQRFEAAKKNSLCINCLSPSHMVKSCSSGSCRICSKRHHTMLHQRNTSENQQAPSSITNSTSFSSQSAILPSLNKPSNSSSSPKTNSALSHENQAPTITATALSTGRFSTPSKENQGYTASTMLLSTALVKVFQPSGSFIWARALLDSGSQLNFISEHLAQKLQVNRSKEVIPISGVGLSATISKHSTIVHIQSRCAKFDTCWKFHILPKITMEIPNHIVDVSQFSWPIHVMLADPTFNKPGRIDMILELKISMIFYERVKFELVLKHQYCKTLLWDG